MPPFQERVGTTQFIARASKPPRPPFWRNGKISVPGMGCSSRAAASLSRWPGSRSIRTKGADFTAPEGAGEVKCCAACGSESACNDCCRSRLGAPRALCRGQVAIPASGRSVAIPGSRGCSAGPGAPGAACNNNNMCVTVFHYYYHYYYYYYYCYHHYHYHY